jgi:tetratricopeptide (TPR) repeat protein
VELTAAIAADPQLREAYVLRGDARLARQEAEPAIGDYAKALELAVDGQVYFKLGLANIQRGDYDQALTDFAKVLELATTISEQERTTIVDAYVERGKILMQQAAERGTQRYADYHFYESARADFSQALELDEKCLPLIGCAATLSWRRVKPTKRWRITTRSLRWRRRTPPLPITGRRS